MLLKKDYIIPLLAIIVITILFILGPIKQNPQYHLFADQRQGWGIPNFLNVITNLPFFIVGILGLHEVTKASEKVLKLIFSFLFIGFLLLTIGSSYYHLWPNNQTLVYDRIPIAIIIMSFFAFIVYDYIDNKKGLPAFFSFNLSWSIKCVILGIRR
jgi:peptidoglycan/LPS O-acetylase OafA/YrhL